MDPSVETLGRGFVEAFNRRDPDGLIAVAHPSIEFYPTGIVGTRRAYRGHDGLRSWMRDLLDGGAVHHVGVREVRPTGADGFVVLSEVVVDGEVLSPSAMVATISEGKIVEARAYLTDEATLTRLGIIAS